MRFLDDLDVIGRKRRIDLPVNEKRRDVARAQAVDLRCSVRVSHSRIIETDVDCPFAVACEGTAFIRNRDRDLSG